MNRYAPNVAIPSLHPNRNPHRYPPPTYQPDTQTTPQPAVTPASQPAAPAYHAQAKTDGAQYIYECGVIGWEAFKKYAVFTGRASRREFWSLYLVYMVCTLFTGGLAGLAFLLPTIGVAIRRMHDINKCGWWCICPIVNLFLFLKRSDPGQNNYGPEEPAQALLHQWQ